MAIRAYNKEFKNTDAAIILEIQSYMTTTQYASKSDINTNCPLTVPLSNGELQQAVIDAGYEIVDI